MNTSKYLLISAVTLTTALLAAPANAQTTVLLAEDNGYIRSGQPDTVQPINNIIMVRSHTSNFARKLYLKFDLSDLLDPEQLFSAAEITLTVKALSGATNTSATYDIYGIIDNNAAWTGSTITWNNAPKNNDLNNGVSAVGTALLGSFSFNSVDIEEGVKINLSGQDYDDYLNWATGNLGDFYDTGETSAANGLVTFIMTPRVASTVDGLEFYSLAGTSVDGQKPQLSFAVIPEPATVGLFFGLVVAVVLVGRRRSRR